MDAILISVFILSCYIVWKIGLRVYRVRRYLKQRRCRSRLAKGHGGQALQADFSGKYHHMSPARIRVC